MLWGIHSAFLIIPILQMRKQRLGEVECLAPPLGSSRARTEIHMINHNGNHFLGTFHETGKVSCALLYVNFFISCGLLPF